MNYEKATDKELKDLEKMVINWKNWYLNEIDPTHKDYNQTLMSDFLEEINTHIFPYIDSIKRNKENNLSEEKENDFFRKVFKHYTDLKWEINKKENENGE